MNIYESLGFDLTELNSSFINIKNEIDFNKAKRNFLAKYPNVKIEYSADKEYIELFQNYQHNPFQQALNTPKKDRVVKYQIPTIILKKYNDNFSVCSFIARNSTLQIRLSLIENNNSFVVLESVKNKALAQSIFIRLEKENIIIERSYVNQDFYIDACIEFSNLFKGFKNSYECVDFLKILFSMESLTQEKQENFLLCHDIDLNKNKSVKFFSGCFYSLSLLKGGIV